MSVSLQQYLDTSFDAFSNLDTYESVTVVVGNEACDLDSIVCSILYGYLLQHKHGGDDVITAPLLQCTKENFHLRGDAVMLFEQFKLDTSKLLFINDIELSSIADSGKLSVVLVDTNTLTPDLKQLAPHVKKIIDHHKDVGDGYHADCERLIELVGSCASLVAELLLAENIVNEVIAELLLAAILVDTCNLSPTANRATDKDRDVAQRLTSLATVSNDELYRSVLGARCNSSAFSVRELLEKDFKVAQRAGVTIGFCSIIGRLEEIVTDKDFVKEATEFCTQEQLDLMLLLGVDIEEAELRGRNIGLFHLPGKSTLKESVASFLKSNKNIRAENETSYGDCVVMKQENMQASRKAILPSVMEFVGGETVAVDPSASLYVNVKAPSSDEKVEDSFVHIDQPNQEGDQSAVLEASQPQAPLEPVVKIITGPKGMESGGAMDYSVSMTSAGSDQLRHKVMEPDEGSNTDLTIKEYSAEEEQKDTRRFRVVTVGDESVKIDMEEVEPYRKVIQHMGYKGTTAIVIISACYLPPRTVPNHASILTQVFYYVIYTLNRLVVDNYIIVYFHSAAPRRSLPGFGLLRRFYQMVDRRLRKNLIQLFVVHPSVWIKTMFVLARPFISSKFYRKVHMLPMINDLGEHLKMDDDLIPQPVVDYDKVLMSRQQRYAVKEPAGNKPGDATPPGGDNDKLHDNTTTATTEDKPSD